MFPHQDEERREGEEECQYGDPHQGSEGVIETLPLWFGRGFGQTEGEGGAVDGEGVVDQGEEVRQQHQTHRQQEGLAVHHVFDRLFVFCFFFMGI